MQHIKHWQIALRELIDNFQRFDSIINTNAIMYENNLPKCTKAEFKCGTDFKIKHAGFQAR